jgi:hypothetical protein
MRCSRRPNRVTPAFPDAWLVARAAELLAVESDLVAEALRAAEGNATRSSSDVPTETRPAPTTPIFMRARSKPRIMSRASCFALFDGDELPAEVPGTLPTNNAARWRCCFARRSPS